MKVATLVAGIVLVYVPTIAFGIQLVPLTATKDSMDWADVQRITGTPDRPKIWALNLYRTTQVSDGKSYDYGWIQLEVSCADSTTRITFASMFTATGSPVETGNVSLTAKPYIPGTEGQDLYDLTCGGESKTRKNIDATPGELLSEYRSGIYDDVVKKTDP